MESATRSAKDVIAVGVVVVVVVVDFVAVVVVIVLLVVVGVRLEDAWNVGDEEAGVV
jgi:hypothetical protein